MGVSQWRDSYGGRWYHEGTYRSGDVGPSIRKGHRAIVERSKKKGFAEWLSLEDYARALGTWACHWCGCTVSVGSGAVGLDRIDNAKGYVGDNVVPCCFKCNVDRGLLMFEEYELVVTFRKNRQRARAIASPREGGRFSRGHVETAHGRSADRMEKAAAGSHLSRHARTKEILAHRIRMRSAGLDPDRDNPPAVPVDGENLLEWRRCTGMTQRQASGFLGIGRRTIQRIESRGGLVPPETAAHIRLLAERQHGLGARGHICFKSNTTP